MRRGTQTDEETHTTDEKTHTNRLGDTHKQMMKHTRTGAFNTNALNLLHRVTFA